MQILINESDQQLISEWGILYPLYVYEFKAISRDCFSLALLAPLNLVQLI